MADHAVEGRMTQGDETHSVREVKAQYDSTHFRHDPHIQNTSAIQYNDRAKLSFACETLNTSVLLALEMFSYCTGRDCCRPRWL